MLMYPPSVTTRRASAGRPQARHACASQSRPSPLPLLLLALLAAAPALAASDYTCPAGATLCDFCPGAWVPKCCAAGQSCVPGFGCISPGFIPCSARCAKTAVACGCPAAAGGSCSVAPKCCNNNCCVAQGTQYGPDSSALLAVGKNSTNTSSPSPSPSNSSPGGSNATCVDASWLERVTSGRHLVHPGAHPIAAVLCPGAGLPCGTPRHVVRIQGVHRTYKELCSVRACEARVMPVNAVYTHRWNRLYGLTVPRVLLDGELVELTMYSDVCNHRLQIVAHWILEAVHGLQARFVPASLISV